MVCETHVSSNHTQALQIVGLPLIRDAITHLVNLWCVDLRGQTLRGELHPHVELLVEVAVLYKIVDAVGVAWSRNKLIVEVDMSR